MDDRSVLVTPERLIIILDRNDILNNMHEAYSRISGTDYDYGCFISGPSKTADIAQALVMGAQAARENRCFTSYNRLSLCIDFLRHGKDTA